MASDQLFAPYESPMRAHLIKPRPSGGGLAAEIWDLRQDLSDTFRRLDVVLGAQPSKTPVRLCTAGALNAYTAAGSGVGKTLTQNAAAVESIDGVALVVGDRILVNNLGTATAADRGIYTVTTVGTGAVKQVLTRATDFDDDTDVVSGVKVTVAEGATLDNSSWLLVTNNPITVDTTGLSFQRELVDVIPTKDPVRLATAGALAAYTAAGSGPTKTLTANAAGVENIDGVAVALGDRILVNNLGTATAADRGIYTVTTVGTGGAAQVLTRASDCDSDSEVVSNITCRVEEGTANAGTNWYLATANPIVVDTTALSWALGYPSTAAPLAASLGAVPAAGSASTYALSDHVHQANTAPADVTKAAAVIGVSTEPARADHKHDISTAAAVDIAGTNAEGGATSLARSDHTHKLATLQHFLAHQGTATAAGNSAAAGTSNAHRVIEFDDGGVALDERYAWEGIFPEHYDGGDITVRLFFAAAAAAGDVKWNVQFERMSDGALDIDAGDGYAAAQTTTTTVPGTAGVVGTSDITFTQAQADGITAGDLFRLLVERHSSDAADTHIGDIDLLGILITQ